MSGCYCCSEEISYKISLFDRRYCTTMGYKLLKIATGAKEKKNSNEIALKIGKPRGRPLLLEEELDHKLWSMLTSLRLAGAGINIHVIRGVLNGLVWANPVKYGKYVEFNVTRSWTRSLYQRMKFSRRAVTTSRPIITRSLWTEVRSQYVFEIIDKALTHDIPDELIINVDQTPSKFVATCDHVC